MLHRLVIPQVPRATAARVLRQFVVGRVTP